MNGLEAPDELQINALRQEATQQNSEKPKPTCFPCKKPIQYRNQCRQLKRQKNQARGKMESAGNNNNSSGQTNSDSDNKISHNTNANNINNSETQKTKACLPTL